MKNLFALLLAVIIFACQPPKAEESNPAEEAFKRNAETVAKDIANWENETMDYSFYSDDYWTMSTMFNAKGDTSFLDEIKEEDKGILEMFDFEQVAELNLLPGVNGDTKEMDGSVRYYGNWKITKPATDSTEEKTGYLPTYHTYEFDEDGKIVTALGYGDFSGVMQYMMSDDEM